jgi:hypothetical protein
MLLSKFNALKICYSWYWSFFISVLQANLSNHMMRSNSVRVNPDKIIGLRQPNLSVILNFNGDAGVRRNEYLNFIS